VRLGKVLGLAECLPGVGSLFAVAGAFFALGTLGLDVIEVADTLDPDPDTLDPAPLDPDDSDPEADFGASTGCGGSGVGAEADAFESAFTAASVSATGFAPWPDVAADSAGLLVWL
jgi:hypothetical protein